MSEMLLNPLNRMQTLSHSLFSSLSLPPTRQTPPPPTSLFIDCDNALAKAVEQARIHQIKQRKIEALKAEVLQLDNQLMELWNDLEQGKQELEAIIDEGNERLEAIERAKAAAVPFPELLAYAQSLSAFTSAPPNMPDIALPGQPPPPLFFPPFPNEEKMRRGRLNAEAPLGQLGETHSVGRPATKSPEKILSQAAQPIPLARDLFRQPSRPQPLPAVDFGLDLNDDDDDDDDDL
ncbi:vitamin-D-receptor interacting mediator subunit 4-domain-containing protein [Hysterangium stoloniferum]|nr:vitamin-D-receptor interacting mediator subunit 4-domain-containing protein [Hysterangium stoloniferum]